MKCLQVAKEQSENLAQLGGTDRAITGARVAGKGSNHNVRAYAT